MKHLSGFKLFESLGKPGRRFPTEKVLNVIDVRNFIEEKYNIKFNNLAPKTPTKNKIHDFNFFTGYENDCLVKRNPKSIVYPKTKLLDTMDRNSPYYDARYEGFVDGDAIVEIPEFHDPSKDKEIFDKRKDNFFRKMRSALGDKFNKDRMGDVNFGPQDFSWANIALEAIHKEFSQYYKNGDLQLWHPKEWSEGAWGHTNPDYPHKYNLYGEPCYEKGLIFLSDIEKYIEHRYGISDDKFYDWIITNDYIEGRYWERIVGISINEDGTLNRGGALNKMQPTENIGHILNILDKDFAQEIKEDYENEQFEIYIDYYKKLGKEAFD